MNRLDCGQHALFIHLPNRDGNGQVKRQREKIIALLFTQALLHPAVDIVVRQALFCRLREIDGLHQTLVYACLNIENSVTHTKNPLRAIRRRARSGEPNP